MKYSWLLLWLLLVSNSLCALPLSEPAQREAQFFMDFLETTYAQRAGDPDRFERLQQLLRQEPQSAYLKEQLVAEALAVNNTHLAQAYIDFINDAQDDPEAWFLYADYQWQTGHRAQALQAYEKALDLDPDNDLILFQYISALSLEDPVKTRDILLDLAKARPNLAPDIYTELGKMYARQKQYPQALELFDKALALDAKNPAPRLGRAGVYEETSQYFLMLHELEMLEQQGYVTPTTLTQMAAVFVMVKDFPRAKTYFERAKQLDNGNVAANHFLALLAEETGNYPAAIAYVKDAADYNTSMQKQVQVAFYQRKLGQHKASLDTLAQACRNFPQEPGPAYFYAVALNEEEQYRKAAQLLVPLIEKDPSQADLRLQYAFALEGQKKYAALEEQLRILLDQNPQHTLALNLWAYSLAVRGERLAQAQEYIARALAVDPTNESFIDTQAWIYFKQGNYARAADVIGALPEEVLAQNEEIAYHAAYIYDALGDKANMQRAYTLGCGNQPAGACFKQFKKIR